MYTPSNMLRVALPVCLIGSVLTLVLCAIGFFLKDSTSTATAKRGVNLQLAGAFFSMPAAFAMLFVIGALYK
jgi:hypothetical protein